MQNEFTFFIYNTLVQSGTFLALKKNVPVTEHPPVIVCIGSDLSIADSLGPICGTKLKDKLKGLNCYVYGTLSKPITAHEIRFLNDFLHQTHPLSPIIAIDAAVGAAGDIGLIKVAKRGVRPGSGANKKLAKVGDASVIGIVAEKSVFNFSILSATRLNMVYKMADAVSEAVATFVMDYLNTSSNSESFKSAI